MTPITLKPSLAHLAALAACFLLFSPALSAQNSGRGFLKAQAGMTLFSDGGDVAAGGGFGVRLTSYLDLFAEAGTVLDVSDYGFIGSRVTLPLQSVITPFFEVGAGAGRLSPYLQQVDTSYMLTASGGVHLAATRRIGFDIAYRYFRILTSPDAVTRSQFYAGIVYRF